MGGGAVTVTAAQRGSSRLPVHQSMQCAFMHRSDRAAGSHQQPQQQHHVYRHFTTVAQLSGEWRPTLPA